MPITSILCSASLFSILPSVRAVDLEVAIEGDFQVRAGGALLPVDPPEWVEVTDERYDGLPVFNPDAAPWMKGIPLRGVDAQECSATGSLDPTSVRVKAAEGEADELEQGADYDVDPFWGSIGRRADGAIAEGQAVYIDYRYSLSRIDSVVVAENGAVTLVRGESHVTVPRPPALAEGETRAANIWLPHALPALTEANLFPIQAEGYPEPAVESPTPAERLVPKAVAKLRSGERLTILAWGDSVTVGTFVPDWQTQRWQEQFVTRLRERFPQADIELVTVAWGGRSMQSFLAEPPGSEYNYREQVLDRRPDLIVSEFVNDAYLDGAGIDAMYGERLADFAEIGAEWIILTPHYVRPDWMGLTSERDCDEDPRPYVKGLREFAPRRQVALADASLRWGHLWRQGIPYTTLLLNAINHQDERGMKLFADALMALFPAE